MCSSRIYTIQYSLLAYQEYFALPIFSQANGDSQRFFLKNTGDLDDWKIQSHFKRYGEILMLPMKMKSEIGFGSQGGCWISQFGHGHY